MEKEPQQPQEQTDDSVNELTVENLNISEPLEGATATVVSTAGDQPSVPETASASGGTAPDQDQQHDLTKPKADSPPAPDVFDVTPSASGVKEELNDESGEAKESTASVAPQNAPEIPETASDGKAQDQDQQLGLPKPKVDSHRDDSGIPPTAFGGHRSAFRLVVCNTDGTNRDENINTKETLIAYLVDLIEHKFEVDPKKPFLVFLTEFNKNFIVDMQSSLHGGNVGFVTNSETGAESDYSVILFNTCGDWQLDNTFNNTGKDENERFVAVALKYKNTQERMLCVCVHNYRWDYNPKADANVTINVQANVWDPLNGLLERAQQESFNYVVVAGDFNVTPAVIASKLIFSDQQIQLALPDETIATTTGGNCIDNVATFGSVTARVEPFNSTENLFRHYPLYGDLQFTD